MRNKWAAAQSICLFKCCVNIQFKWEWNRFGRNFIENTQSVYACRSPPVSNTLIVWLKLSIGLLLVGVWLLFFSAAYKNSCAFDFQFYSHWGVWINVNESDAWGSQNTQETLNRWTQLAPFVSIDIGRPIKSIDEWSNLLLQVYTNWSIRKHRIWRSTRFLRIPKNT